MTTSTTSAKKPIIRRGRQKKDLLDDEDLQRQQELEKRVLQGKLKQESGDIFDTAKLDKNYFLRQENKTSHHQSQIFNFDDDQQDTNQSNHVITPTKDLLDKRNNSKYGLQSQNNQRQQQKKSLTVTKRRQQRKKQRNGNIFDQDQEEDNEQQEYVGRRENRQFQLTRQQFDRERVENNQQQQYQKQQKQQQFKTTNTKQQQQLKLSNVSDHHQSIHHSDHCEDDGDEEVISQHGEGQSQENKKTKKDNQGNNDCDIEKMQSDDGDDQFDNVIKNQQQKSQDQQKQFILHKELAKLTNKQDRKMFYYQTLKPNHVACAYFKRFSSGLSQIYQLCGEDHRPLLFCENQRGCIGANYYISISKEMDKNNPNYLGKFCLLYEGKLRGNASGSIYSLYDDGIQPKNQMNRSDWRVSMAAVQYENNFMGMNGPRRIKVTTPSAKLIEQDVDLYKLSQQESLLSFQPPVITQFRNKTPKWNQRLKSYALNFGGRVKLASIKNFILIDNKYRIDQEEEADNVIVFGKIDETTFSLEYRYPLSLYQAFGIVMSQFDFKINCE